MAFFRFFRWWYIILVMVVNQCPHTCCAHVLHAEIFFTFIPQQYVAASSIHNKMLQCHLRWTAGACVRHNTQAYTKLSKKLPLQLS